MLNMNVSHLTVDPVTHMPLLILQDAAGIEAVPIWIGSAEAAAIASQLENVEMERPVAHDLMKNLIGQCGLRVERVEVRDLKGSTFYASIILERQPGELIELDARPSDAIALALRTGASIAVAPRVVEKTRKLGRSLARQSLKARRRSEPADDEYTDTVAPLPPDLLDQLRDEDFGKWKM
ncbi:MAG TPA: bifunctional nuclease family protein [Polyangia bacterium]|nr:bifunctional nuclease family protein [Polyangia bacterium]